MVTVEGVRRVVIVSGMALALAACGDRARPASTTELASAKATSAPPPVASVTDRRTESEKASPAAPSEAPRPVTPPPPGAIGTGEGDCNVLRGPAKLTTSGAIVIGPGTGGLLAFATNKLGAPAWETPIFPEPTKQGPATLLPKAPPPAPTLLASSSPSSAQAPSATAIAEEDRSRLPACAIADGFTFCVDGEGQIHRRKKGSDDDKVIAKGRKGTVVAAAAQGGHTFYAFLANQRTTEGLIARAFVGLDDETPIPLSEEGSGATFVGLVARDHDVLAMYIDARTALTPVHARTLRAEGRLVRGSDAVVFVGGGADGHVRGAVGRSHDGPALLFVTGSRDDKDFGVVTIVVDGEPKDDLPGKWSIYPAAITTSPLAATTGKSPVRLARVRPESKEPDAGQVLDLGHVDRAGAFAEKCVVTKASSLSDVSLAVDEKGALWVAYTSKQGTFVEQRGPSK